VLFDLSIFLGIAMALPEIFRSSHGKNGPVPSLLKALKCLLLLGPRLFMVFFAGFGSTSFRHEANLNMAIEIVDFTMKNGGSFHSYVAVYQRVNHGFFLVEP